MRGIVEHHMSEIIKLIVAHNVGPHEGSVRNRYSKLHTHESDKGVVGKFSSAGEGRANSLIKINDTNTNSDEQQGRLRRLRSIGP